MLQGMDEKSTYDARTIAKVKRGRTWPVYKRLLGYVMRHKRRLAVAFVLALFVAGSFGAILLGAKTVVDITFGEEVAVQEWVAATQADITDRTDAIRNTIGWAPSGLDGYVQHLVDFLRADPDRAMICLAGFVLGVTIIGGLARFFQEYLAASIATFVGIRLGQEMYRNILSQSLTFFEKHTTGEIIARLTNDVFMAGRGLSQVFMKLMREPIKAAVFLGIAISVDAGLTLIGLAVLPPVAYVMIKIGQRVRKRMRRSLEKVALLQSSAKESITGIAIVKAFCMEPYDSERVHKEYVMLQRQGLKMMRADAAIGPATELVMMLGVVVFIVLSARKVTSGELSLSDLGTLYIALGGMLDPVRKLSAVNNAIQSSVASAERAFQFIDMKPDIVDAPGAIELPPIKEALRFEHVAYTYDGETPVLTDLNFEVKKGEMVAIVGESGAGKSTIAKLIPRFYDVTDGAISIDGVDIRTATMQSLRRQIGIVTQDTILFNDSVAANIAAGSPNYSPERIQEAARAAHASGFVEALPRGYETGIGEAGGTLSGGQRQRLAIARALVRDPALLILDEATSSLDSESEKAIQEAIEEFVVGRTSIVIAHRLSTVQRADRILVLDKGRVVEQGSHEELLAREGSIYKRLYEVQFATRGKENGEG